MSATIVAWHGPKPRALAELVERVQRAAGAGLAPRPTPDVHATILGLETAVSDRSPDRDGVIRHLGAEFEHAPVDVQFGGFAATDRRLSSRGQTLHERTLGVQGGQLVLIGWPVTPAPSPRLGEIRRRCERFGFRHKYHRTPDDLDPDAYLVLGDVAGPEPGLVERLRREVLATPVRVPLTVADVALVEYVDPGLPAATSTRWPLTALTRR